MSEKGDTVNSEGLVDYSPWGYKRVRLDSVTKQQQQLVNNILLVFFFKSICQFLFIGAIVGHLYLM